MEFSHIKKGAILVFKDKYPCKVVSEKFSKPGKHGHAKKACTGIDLITDKKYEQIFNHHTILKEPKIERIGYLLLGIEDGYLSLMNLLDTDDIREDMKLPENEIGDKLTDMFEKEVPTRVTVLFATVDENEQYRVIDVSEDKE